MEEVGPFGFCALQYFTGKAKESFAPFAARILGTSEKSGSAPDSEASARKTLIFWTRPLVELDLEEGQTSAVRMRRVTGGATGLKVVMESITSQTP